MLRESKIGYFDMTVVVEQNIFRIEITVDDIKGMQVIEGEGHFCCIKFCDWIREPLTSHVNGRERDNKGGRTFDLLKRVNSSPPGT